MDKIGLIVPNGDSIMQKNMQYTYDHRIAYYVEKIIIYK